MGWNQRMVDETGLWEFMEALRGWNKAQGGDESAGVKPPTPEEHDRLVERFG